MMENTSLKKYIIMFYGTYLLLTLVVVGIIMFFDIESNSMSIAALVMSAYIPGATFVNDTLRLPTKSEKNKLILHSSIAAIVITIILVGGLSLVYPSLPSELSQMFASRSIGFFIFVFGFAFVLTLFAVWLGYTLSIKTQYKVLEKQGKV